MGEFSPFFSESPSFFLSFFSSSVIEIMFDFSDIITKIHPHFKILDPPLSVTIRCDKIWRNYFSVCFPYS